jgi:hypothetical protein
MNLQDILNIFKEDDLDNFLFKNFGFAKKEKYDYEKISNIWKYVGNNESNASAINSLDNPEKGLVERITNAIDAVIEKKKVDHSVQTTTKTEKIVKEAFPKYFDNRTKVLSGQSDRNLEVDAKDQIIVAISNGLKSISPTFDVIDKGTGIRPEDFADTILSLHKGNKIKEEKGYLIGSFGQGGSTSLKFSKATIIVSKFNGNFSFTVIKKFNIVGLKNHAYMFLHQSNKIIELENKTEKNEIYLNDFVANNTTSGTLVRMIDYEIPKAFRDKDITKPMGLEDYFNIELHNVFLPIKLVENRIEYKSNQNAQSRSVYGNKMKLQTWEYVKKQYSGSIKVNFDKSELNIEYYVILPNDETKWGIDSECSSVYKQMNFHEKPIFFIVNGQYINGENFTKLKNSGLSFLQHRLMVIINLDDFNSEKYNYFTSDRNRINKSDKANDLIDEVVKNISNQATLIELNKVISEKSINSSFDDITKQMLAKEIKDAYQEFLQPKRDTVSPDGPRPGKTSEENLLEYISYLVITNSKEKYYKNEEIRIFLETGAYKIVNQTTKINCFIDNSNFNDITESFMNGRIQYVLGKLKPGIHSIKFSIFKSSGAIESNEYSFEIIDQDLEQKSSKTNSFLDLNIESVDGRELIIEIVRNANEKKITAYVCLNHELLRKNYNNITEEKINKIKKNITKPMVLMALFLKDDYENFDTELKNKIISNLVDSILKSKIIDLN